MSTTETPPADQQDIDMWTDTSEIPDLFQFMFSPTMEEITRDLSDEERLKFYEDTMQFVRGMMSSAVDELEDSLKNEKQIGTLSEPLKRHYAEFIARILRMRADLVQTPENTDINTLFDKYQNITTILKDTHKFLSARLKNIENENKNADAKASKNVTPAEAPQPSTAKVDLTSTKAVKAELDKDVIGQDGAKKVIAIAVRDFKRRIEKKAADPNARDGIKSNILLVGPTGTGKTELVHSLARILDVPFTEGDATEWTPQSYVNGKVQEVLQKLVDNAGGDIKKLARGAVIYIDEFDKLDPRVQEELLKMTEGKKVMIKISKTVKINGQMANAFEEREIDTGPILFIGAGALQAGKAGKVSHLARPSPPSTENATAEKNPECLP